MYVDAPNLISRIREFTDILGRNLWVQLVAQQVRWIREGIRLISMLDTSRSPPLVSTFTSPMGTNSENEIYQGHQPFQVLERFMIGRNTGATTLRWGVNRFRVRSFVPSALTTHSLSRILLLQC